MREYSELMKNGSLVKTRYGECGIVVSYDWRRDHHYLERDLWLLVLIEEKNVWVRADDLQSWECDNAEHL